MSMMSSALNDFDHEATGLMATCRLKLSRPLLWLLVVASFWVWTTGCGTTKEAARSDELRPGQTRLKVASFEVRGTERFSAGEIKDGLATREDPGWRTAISWMPLLGAENKYFNRIEWRRDLERIQTFYRMRGHFNARIVSQNIVESREENAVRISIRIAEGEPTRVETMQIEGLDMLEPDIREEVTRDLSLEQGEIFTQQKYVNTRNALVQRLNSRAFAYANISGRAVVDPQANEANVFYFLDPGPKARFGEIRIMGNDEIPSRWVRDAIDLESGELYSAEKIEQAQEDIYAMEVFSLVSVLPAHEARAEVLEEADFEPEQLEGVPVQDDTADPTDGETTPEPVDDAEEQVGPEVREEIQELEEDEEAEAPGALGISDVLASAQQQAERRMDLEQSVPVIIRLKEGRMWNVEVGAGVAIQSNRQDIHAQANWSSRNFLGGLRKLEHINTFGYAWANNASDSNLSRPFGLGGTTTEGDNEGFFLRSDLEFRQPRFIEPKTSLRIAPSLRRDVEVGYTVWNPKATIGLERTFFRHLTVGLNYGVSYFRFTDLTSTLLSDTPLGADFREEFLLEWLEQRFALDYRDNPLDPRSGTLTQLTIQEASSYLVGGEFQYLKVTAGTEGYVPFSFLTDWVLSARVRAGSIYNTESVEEGDDAEDVNRVPALSRLSSGGRGRMRSFGHNNVSFFRVGAFNPTLPREVQEVEVIPVGGLSIFEVSVEPRFRLVQNLAGLGDLWGAVFYDAATTLDRQLFYATEASELLGRETGTFDELTSTILHGVGTGVYWLTPVGPVRADFALTLNDLTDDPRFRTCGPPDRVRGTVTETGEEDCTFLPLERDPVQQQLNLKYSFYIGIGHSF